MPIYEAYAKAQETGKDGKIVLRKEQKDAVKEALAVFRKPFSDKNPYHKFLWNAKMRFGKTLCAMELAKEMGAKRTLIVTHRPVVNAGWQVDFNKIFEHNPHYRFDTKFENDNFDSDDFKKLEDFAEGEGNHYVLFVSIQYLDRSILVSEKGNDDPLKKKILLNHWDLVVADEAHEGMLAPLGKRVMGHLGKPKTCLLHLSGTPFNLYDDFEEGEVFTWDYIAEQKAKAQWKVDNPLLPNPYADLPSMEIYTYDLGNLVKGEGLVRDDAGFMFSEFFRTWTGNAKKDGKRVPESEKGKFVHEKSVKEFLDLLCKKDDKSNYPFSTDEYQKNFKHTLWVVPGVAAAKALKKLLDEHRVFKHFQVVNVAGNTDEEEEDENALKKVLNAIGYDPEKENNSAPEKKYTITLSCGRLTTGVTVPPWTAVFYLKGSENTNAATYMQTIFRVQTPYHTSEGRMKAKAFVFDFAPDRSLKMLAETARFSAKTARKDKIFASKIADQKELAAMKELLAFCPVIAFDGSEMKKFDDEQALFAKLAEAKIDRVVKRGFDDNALYNVEELLKMDPDAVNQLLKLLGKTKGSTEATKIDLGKAGLTGKGKKGEKANGGGEDGAGEGGGEGEDAEAKAAKKAAKKERDNRIAILRGVSLRIPLLIFGAEVTDESVAITVDNFTKVIDDASWLEFMPRNFTKAEFEKIKVCYDRVTFVESGRRYRQLAREADGYSIEDRIKAITTIFGYFHNPDKETVLTPWRVVNMHMSDTIGGWCFYNEQFDGPNFKEVGRACRPATADGRAGAPRTPQLVETNEPRFVDQPGVTSAIFQQANEDGDTPVKILEINSKTGLYPLYVAYSLYRGILPIWAKLYGEDNYLTLKDQQALWDQILEKNIFVICNTPMAAAITRRTLCGFRKVEGLHIKDIKLVDEATKNQAALVKLLNSKSFWNLEGEGDMKFNAIVGNPPYQSITGGGSEKVVAATQAIPIFNKFVDCSLSLEPSCVSLIIPARWYSGGMGLNDFRDRMLHDRRMRKLYDFIDSRDCFKSADIAGGLCYFLWDKMYKGNCEVVNISGNVKRSRVRPLDGFGDIFIRYNSAIGIIDKVKKRATKFLDSSVMPIDAFGFPSKSRGEVTKFKGAISLIHSCGVGYVRKSEIKKNSELIDKYKVTIGILVPCNGEVGIDPRKGYKSITTPRILNPGEVTTFSYLVLGAFETEDEAVNFKEYMLCKFSRFMLRLTYSSMHISKQNFILVPKLDFKKKWTDKKLYAYFDLSESEQAIIDSTMRVIVDDRKS